MVLPVENITVTEDFEVISEAQLPTRTYKLDFERGRCTGFIDRKTAMEQAILKVIRTKRFAHLIYSDNYGFQDMIGRDRLFVRGELPRRIKEALLQDERITAIENFRLDFEKDEAYVSLTAVTIYGDVDVLREAIPFV
ncbi:DUF2634 domain-containing protein [Cytobacillus firmus]|uniref:DUF2634 domain-containing protein n=1 Tax=Cytobacillus firmus TaxID=1399 RepID=UPI0018CDD1A5|nr:DUF2634 domain-containing protein [Cytobacillus firmus]MBG9657812.1 hypothetical protein [Cytobacillus firmus]MED1904814.1 DUF2634 domain-containing protein [Cytobacillus firmus]